jgi:hypothetical protein
MYRLMLVAGVMVTLAGSVRTVSADDIPCPVQKATWVITTPLPDPWSGPTEVGQLAQQSSAFINGRDWIICKYANDNDSEQQSVFRRLHLPFGGPYLVDISRPAASNVQSREIDCPVTELSVGLKTNVRSPWTSTTYVFRLDRKFLRSPPFPARIVCEYRSFKHDVWGAGPSAILRPVKPDTGPGLTGTPTPDPSRPDTLTATFGVTGVTLSTNAEVRAACPANVKFRGYIHTNGAGTVRYRVVHNGRPGGPKEMDFDRAEGRPVLFDVEVGGGDSSDSVTARPKPAAPGSITAAPAPGNRLSGWARIEILAPHAGVTRSDIASYVVSCTASRPDRLKK